MISVALCTYNGAKFIREQLDSIVGQTLPPDEIVVCDDQSTDDTLTIVHDVLDQWNGQTQIVCNEENLGFRQNFAKAISLCHGNIIYLSDQDDIWKSEKIAVMQHTFQDNPDASVVFHDATLIQQDGQVLFDSYWKVINYEPTRFLVHDYNLLLERSVVQGCACAFKKEAFTKSLPFPKGAYHDEWIALTALTLGNIVPIPQSLLLYRQHIENVIGGVPLTFSQKWDKWMGNIPERTQLYHTELLRWQLMIDTFCKRFNGTPGLSDKMNYLGFQKFLHKRIHCIETNSWSIILWWPKYFKYIKLMKDVVKTIIRDFYAVLFYR